MLFVHDCLEPTRFLGWIAAMSRTALLPRPRAGRPTREQAEARHAELLDRALDHFLDKGYDQTTIEAIAADVGMTKRTVYARYADKASLFRGAVRRAVESYKLPIEALENAITDDLAQTLINIAMIRLELITSPQGVKLQRIINVESYRFIDVFKNTYELAGRQTIRFLADFFEREAETGRLAVDQPLLAATVFMSMVISGPARLVMGDSPIAEDHLRKRVEFCVGIFLEGTKPR
jgi:TetR/AcrR family transcriptional repressor of mexJK operon